MTRTTRIVRPCGALLLAFAIVPAPVFAQNDAPGKFEAGVVFGWMGGSPGGSATALETPNQRGGLPRLTLFEADARLESTSAVTALVAFNLTPTIAVEGGLRYARPVLRTEVTADFEGAADRTIDSAPLRQYVADVGLVVHLRALAFGGGGVPFFTAAVGYLRELNGDQTVVEDGRAYRLGGGVKQPLGGWGGLRFDAGLGVRDGGFSLDEPRVRAFFTAGIGVFVVF